MDPRAGDPRGTSQGAVAARGFRFHDLRHFLASLLIASGADVKVVQARLRHASAKTTLDTYGHLWPDATSPHWPPWVRVLAARADSLRTMVQAGG